jgi:hypothetical protein
MTAAAPHDVKHIVLEGVPAATLLRSQDHIDELVREFQIVAIGIHSGVHEDVPKRIATVLEDVLERYAAIRNVNRSIAMREIEAGRDTMTWEMERPAGAAADVRRALDILAEVDRLCREGELLTLECPADIRAFRDDVAAEVIRQLES